MAIMHYLEETRPQRPLLPQDVHKRAKVREICEVITSGIQPLQNLIVLIHVGEEKKKEWAQHWITRGFRAVEKLLSTSAGKFCVGDDISFADTCLVPQVIQLKLTTMPIQNNKNCVYCFSAGFQCKKIPRRLETISNYFAHRQRVGKSSCIPCSSSISSARLPT